LPLVEPALSWQCHYYRLASRFIGSYCLCVACVVSSAVNYAESSAMTRPWNLAARLIKVVYDLHLHSTYSDGSDTPYELVDKAHAFNCEVIALTDHDSTDGYEEARKRASELGMTLIKGVEMSIPARQLGTFHVLVYLPSEDTTILEQRLDLLREKRKERNERLVASLRDAGIDITMEMVAAKATQGNVARPHFAAVLIDLGVVDSIDEAFDRYLGDSTPFDIEKEGLSIEELLQLTQESKGLASIAHPLTLRVSKEELTDMLERLRGLGLFGLESYYSRYSPSVRAELVEMANRIGLVPTGGSDYHGTFKVGLNPGVGEGDLRVPEESVAAILARL